MGSNSFVRQVISEQTARFRGELTINTLAKGRSSHVSRDMLRPQVEGRDREELETEVITHFDVVPLRSFADATLTRTSLLVLHLVKSLPSRVSYVSLIAR